MINNQIIFGLVSSVLLLLVFALTLFYLIKKNGKFIPLIIGMINILLIIPIFFLTLDIFSSPFQTLNPLLIVFFMGIIYTAILFVINFVTYKIMFKKYDKFTDAVVYGVGSGALAALVYSLLFISISVYTLVMKAGGNISGIDVSSGVLNLKDGGKIVLQDNNSYILLPISIIGVTLVLVAFGMAFFFNNNQGKKLIMAVPTISLLLDFMVILNYFGKEESENLITLPWILLLVGVASFVITSIYSSKIIKHNEESKKQYKNLFSD